MQLQGKTAIITGGGRGIGRALAVGFARAGADVCVTARSENEIETVAAEIRELGRRGLAIACDMADAAAVQDAFERAAAALGRIDVLVNNAGGAFRRATVRDSDPHDWNTTIAVNLMGTYHGCRAVLPYMIAGGGGKIINVGSGMGHSPRGGNAAYNTAKAGVWMLTRCLALEVWQHGVEVNELIPGPVDTELTKDIFDPSGQLPPPVADSERVKQPEECLPLALFLAAHPPGGPTGQSFSLARRPL